MGSVSVERAQGKSSDDEIKGENKFMCPIFQLEMAAYFMFYAV